MYIAAIILLILSLTSLVLHKTIKTKLKDYFNLSIYLFLFLSVIFNILDKSYGLENKTIAFYIITLIAFFILLIGKIILVIFSEKIIIDKNIFELITIFVFAIILISALSVYFGFSFISLIFFLGLLIIYYIVSLKFDKNPDRFSLIELFVFGTIISYFLSESITALIIINDKDIIISSILFSLGGLFLYLYSLFMAPKNIYRINIKLLSDNLIFILDILKVFSFILIATALFFII